MNNTPDPNQAGLITSLSGIDIDLAPHLAVDTPSIERISRAQVAQLAKKVSNERMDVSTTPVLELSARHPFDAARGRIDSYHPGRWDTESNLVYMTAIHQVGPSVGEWDGTVIYAMFDAPASGTYLIVGNFSGHDCTMRLSGPWGQTEAHTATTSDPGAVMASWSGSGALFFTMTCQGSLMGYLESLQVFAL